MASSITSGNATNGLAIASDNTGALDIKTGTGSGTTAISISSTQVVTGTAGNLMLISGTLQNSTSGTSIDFTGIPSWVKRITVMLAGVSLSTTASTIVLRIGSGSFDATGYVGGFGLANSASAANATASTVGIPLANLTNAADTVQGAVVLTNLTGNQWAAQGNFFRSSGTTSAATMTASTKTLAGVLDRVQVTLDSTGAFDAGSINILYE